MIMPISLGRIRASLSCNFKDFDLGIMRAGGIVLIMIHLLINRK